MSTEVVARGRVAVQVDAAGRLEQTSHLDQPQPHVAEVGQHPRLAEDLPQADRHGVERMTHGPLDVPHAVGGASVPLPRIDEAPDLGGSAVLPAEDDVVVGVAVERRVEVEEVDRLIGPLDASSPGNRRSRGRCLACARSVEPGARAGDAARPGNDPLRGSAYLPMAARREHGPCHKRRPHRPPERAGASGGSRRYRPEPCPANRRARRRDHTNATPSGFGHDERPSMKSLDRITLDPAVMGGKACRRPDAGHGGNGGGSPGGRSLPCRNPRGLSVS